MNPLLIAAAFSLSLFGVALAPLEAGRVADAEFSIATGAPVDTGAPVATDPPGPGPVQGVRANAASRQLEAGQRPVGALSSLLVPAAAIVDSAPVTPPEFGAAVALDAGDGNRAALAYVGAPRAHVHGGARGVVQVFRAPGGGHGQWLGGQGYSIEGRGLSVGARFGAAVAALDGFLAVGAPGADSRSGEGSGIVRMYSAPGAAAGSRLPPRLLAELRPTADSAGAAFGQTLAMERSEEGKLLRLAVGAPHAVSAQPSNVPSAGRVFVYRRGTGGNFALEFEAEAPEPRIAATFGASLCFAGGLLLVGAPGDGKLAPGAGRLFGFGAEGDCLFELAPPFTDGAGGHQGAAGVRLGTALCPVGSDGFAVSSYGRGLVEVFRVVPGTSPGVPPVHQQTVMGSAAAGFGTSLTTSGELLLVGAPGAPAGNPAGNGPVPAAGQVQVFAKLGGRWRTVGALRSVMPFRQGEFGAALANAGGYSVVGEPGSSGACPGGTPCQAGLGAVFRMPR